MNIQFNIDWHGHLDISQYVREAEPKQRNTEVRSAIYGRTDQNKIELYLDDDAEYAPLVRLLDFLRAIKNPDVTIYSGHGSIDNMQTRILSPNRPIYFYFLANYPYSRSKKPRRVSFPRTCLSSRRNYR